MLAEGDTTRRMLAAGGILLGVAGAARGARRAPPEVNAAGCGEGAVREKVDVTTVCVLNVD